MKEKIVNIKERLNPEQLTLNRIQLNRFAQMSGADLKDIKGKNLADLSAKFKWHFDPDFFLFRKVCGKVVKKDPVSGEDLPVPFATVYVEDTDCNIITYSPHGYPWIWHFPFGCHREVIAKTKTDECGNFCVWVPRFDIDWILRWRKLWLCYPVIFKRPYIDDYLVKYPPIPGPDPGPYMREHLQINSISGGNVELIEEKLNRIQDDMPANLAQSQIEGMTNRRVFDHEVPPPLPMEFQKVLSDQETVKSKKASAIDAIRTVLAEHLGVDVTTEIIKGFNPNIFIGPFYRCREIYVPVWQHYFDVPDITFRVTQDINGDGNEETIYSEGFFDVRWNSGPIPDVTLVASSNAKESHVCNVPDVPCGTVPALLAAGMMPLNNASYFNAASGYSIRPNRPKPGLIRPHAETPFFGTLGLFGCVDVQNAIYYRIEQSTNGGATFSAITGLHWNNYLSVNGTPVPIVADTNGWYPVRPLHPVNAAPIPRGSLELPTLVFVWPTPLLQKTILRIELGNNAKGHMNYSTPVAIQSDNTAPTINYTRWSWKFAGEPDTSMRNLLGIACPMIKRGAVPKDIELIFEVSVSANHLRDANIWTSGCGGGNFIPAADPSNHHYHWHQTVHDNSVILYQRYSLSAAMLPGCYTFHTLATSRSVNPAGIHGESLVPPDWFIDEYFIYRRPFISVAVVNENL